MKTNFLDGPKVIFSGCVGKLWRDAVFTVTNLSDSSGVLWVDVSLESLCMMLCSP